jgi:hypothetical protein
MRIVNGLGEGVEGIGFGGPVFVPQGWSLGGFWSGVGVECFEKRFALKQGAVVGAECC